MREIINDHPVTSLDRSVYPVNGRRCGHGPRSGAGAGATAGDPSRHRARRTGQTLHQPFADAAIAVAARDGGKEGFAVDYIRTTDPIDEAYLAAHDLFIQVNYPPYRWTPVAEAAFRKAMEQGTIGWVGFHHASLLGKFDGFEMSPFFHQFMGRIVFKSYIPDFATGMVHVEDAAHPVFTGLPPTSRSRTTSGTPTTGRRGRTCRCWPLSTRTATSRRVR